MGILDLTNFENAPLEHDPFDFIVAQDVMSADAIAALNRDYPAIELPTNYNPEDLEYGPSFQQLLDELNSAEFDSIIESKFGVDLDGTEKTITVRKYSEMSDGNIHTDHWSKIITVLIYFNPDWNQEGGRLRFLRSKNDIEDYAAEITPIGGNMLAFRRCKKSFHGYKRFEGERRMVQVNWIKSSRFAWYAQQLARLGTHTGKRLLRMTQGS
ncbi:MAG: 2OG-Fe(II) oxygenase [Thiogranum sp.]